MRVTLADIAEDLGKIAESGNKAVLVNNGHGFNIEAICPDMRPREVLREDEIVFQKSEDKSKSFLEIKIVSEVCLETLIQWIMNYFFLWEVEPDMEAVTIVWKKDSLCCSL